MFQLRKMKSLVTALFTLWFFVSGPAVMESQEWKQYINVEKEGWSTPAIEDARQYAAQIGSSAVMIVDRGNVAAAWGNVEHPFKAASVRKSIYDATFGAVDLKEPLRLDATLKQLDIDDIEVLTEKEKTATFEQMMMARSGVYHPAAYETRSNSERRPERGSAAAGEKWYYNNWDYNLICNAFSIQTGMSVDSAFNQRIAAPLGMEDFKPLHIFDWLEPRVSNHPAVTFRISARDLARIGKLYLAKGKWEGEQIVADNWIRRSTAFHTTFEEGHYGGEGNGYGRLWWVYPPRKNSKTAYERYRRFAARGSGGQIMVLFPDLDLLIVHLADTDSGRGVSDDDIEKLMEMILNARQGNPSGNPALGALKPEKLPGKTPVRLREDYEVPPAGFQTKLEGTFLFANGAGIRFYRYEGRLFLEPLGMPLADAETFLISDGSLRSPLVDFVIEPVKEANGSIDSLKMTFRGQTLLGKRSN